MHSQPTAATSIPLGLCQCGCGRKTKIAAETSTRRGHVKGQPMPYISGHTGPPTPTVPTFRPGEDVPHQDTPWDFRIPLRRRDRTIRAYALLDREDYERFGRYRWGAQGAYAARRRGGRMVKLHREILGLVPGDGWEGDHINGDPLDNRRSNLRIVTQAQQLQNKVSYRGSRSAYRGVSWHKRSGTWHARAQIAGKSYFLGQFAVEEDARDAAQAFRDEHMPYAVRR